MVEKLYRLIHDFLFNAPAVSDMNLAEYLITNGVTIPVRCKDCKHWSYISGLDKEPHCTVFCGLHSKAYQTDQDDYCSKGERKNNG